jgi:putative tricarboxylic transport membrane protein
MNRSVFDLGLLYLVGGAGFIMRIFGVPLVPAVMGLILGPIAELQFRRAMAISQGNVTVLITRPICAVLLAATVAILIGPALLRSKSAPRETRDVDVVG